MPARRLFLHVRGLICARHKQPVTAVLETLALMVSGRLLGRSVQLWEIALWIPWDIQLPSGVRRFERWLADPHVVVADLFCAVRMGHASQLGQRDGLPDSGLHASRAAVSDPAGIAGLP